MNAEQSNHSRHQSQIEEVKESLNRLTLNFKSSEIQQQYEQAIYKQKANQLLKIYFLLASVSTIAIIQQSIDISNSSDQFFLFHLIGLSSAFVIISCLLRYLPKFTRIWNLAGIFSLNISILLIFLFITDHESQDNLKGFAFICIVVCFILQRYISNFVLILLSFVATFATVSLMLSYQFYGFMGISLIVALYNLYQTEYLQKQAFWFERFNYQQNHIIENVVTSSLFYIRYNKKEERLEFQRGNKRFCDKFDVKDDETMRYFLKNTKISHRSSEEQQTINSMWNSVNSTWKSSLDGLIHKKIKDLSLKLQSQLNLNHINNQLKEISNSMLKEKGQSNSTSAPQQQYIPNQASQPQPLSIIESNGQSGYLSHKSSSHQKNPSPPIKGKRLPQTSYIQNETNINEFERDKQIVSRDELDHNLIPSSQYMSRQNINILSPPNHQKKTFLLTDEQASISKKGIGEDEFEKEREEIREQIRQVNPKQSKLKRLNSGLQNISQPSPSLGIQRTFTWKHNNQDSQVYKAKYLNQAGEKIKFLVRILIFQMNDTYIAVSIEKEEKNKKYKQLKNRLSFFESVFTQLVSDCNKKSGQELYILRNLIPLSVQVEQQLSQMSQVQQNLANQLSSQLLSLNIEYPRRQSIEKYLQKQLIRDSSLSINAKGNCKEQTSSKNIRQKGLSATTALNTTCITLNQQGITLNQQDITLNQEGITLNQQGITATSTTTTTTTAFTTTTTTVPIPNLQGVGVLKKPNLSPQTTKNSENIQQLQDIPQRDSFQAVLPMINAAKSDQSEGSKASSPTEKTVLTEQLSSNPNSSQYNNNGNSQKQNNQQQQIPIQLQQKISQNNIQVYNALAQQKIQKGQFQQKLNSMLYLTYNGRYTIMNYNYFFEFFKKRTHLEIFTCMSLSGLIDNVVQMFKQELKQKKIQIFTDYFDKETRINTDQNALRQILFNFLQNALQYTPSNGFIALKTEQDTKYKDCVKLKIRNSYNQQNTEKQFSLLPESEDCKLKIDDMQNYLKRKGRINLGLRVSQRLIKIIGPTDKMILKCDKPDYFQVEFSLYNNLNVVQKGSYSQLPSQKALHTSYAMSQDKNNNNSEKGLNGSNNLHAIQTEGQISDLPKKNLVGLYQTVFKSSQNPFSNQTQNKIENSDQSFNSFIEQVINQSQSIENDFERKTLSADRFKHLY